MNKILSLTTLLLLIFSCSTYSEKDKQNFDSQIKKYLDKKGIKCERTESGLYYKIIEPGEGEYIRFQDSVKFEYKGSLLNDEVFDDHVIIETEVKNLIGAWKELMFELKPGAKAYMVTPPQLAYGNKKLDDIPENSILIYEIKIISVK